MPSSSLRVDIAAAGSGSRLRLAMPELGYPSNYPKHLLLTGNSGDETLLGRIVRYSLEDPLDDSPVIHANGDDVTLIERHPDIDPRAIVAHGKLDTAFGPFMRRLLGQGVRTVGASADNYTSDFSWDRVLDHHDSHRFPVTFVVGQCVEVDEGAVFDIDNDGRIERFYRPSRTSSESFINIGLYVFDPSRLVLSGLEKIGLTTDSLDPVQASPEEIVNQLIADGLVGAYMLPPASSFNVNTLETYQALRQHTLDAFAVQPI